MEEKNKEFVEMMLKKAEEKKDTEAQDRTGNVDHKEIEALVDCMQEIRSKSKKQQ